MCRHAHRTYRDHYACFDCRKVFRPALPARESLPQACRECGQPMARMGRDFAAPRAADLRAWKRVRSLYLAGFRWASCGCGPGLPRDARSHGRRKGRPSRDAAALTPSA